MLETDDYLHHLTTESARFREVLADVDPVMRVPSCPDWVAADLVWHLGEVQHYWGTIVQDRPKSPENYEEPARPSSYPELLAFLDDSAARLRRTLSDADPADPCWTWSTDQTVGFVIRRQAHEALIHRLDAELTARAVTELDATLAADGVLEALDVFYGGCPQWGSISGLPHYLRVDCTDTGDQVWVQLGQCSGVDPDGIDHHDDHITVVSRPEAEPDAVIDGPAAALDAWLWRRGDDSQIRLHGDRAVYDHFRLAVHSPIV